MNYGVSGKKNSSGSFSAIIVRLALVLSVLAAGLIFFIVLTVISSNNLMSIESESVSNVPSNILPSYSTCAFESFDEQTNLSGTFAISADPVELQVA